MFMGYYLYGSQDLLLNIPAFFADKVAYIHVVKYVVWLLWALVLSLPYLAFRKKSYSHFIAALIIVSLPPIGVLGWMSQLSAAGWLFPDFGYLGIVLTIGLFSVIAVGKMQHVYRVAIFCFLLLLVGNGIYELHLQKTTQPANEFAFRQKDQSVVIKTLDTVMPHNGELNGMQEFANVDYIKRIVSESIHNRKSRELTYIVLPEEVLSVWRPAKSFWMGDFVQEMARKNVFLIVGADKLHADNKNLYDDAVLFLFPGGNKGVGATRDYKIAAAKVPMPGGNWNVFGLGNQKTARLDLFGRHSANRAELSGIKVYFSVCYEDFLLWPHLNLFSNQDNRARADVWISMANNWFQTKDALAFKIQESTVQSSARLFGSPLLRAVNTKTLVYKK